MKKAELKQKAREELLSAMQVSFSTIAEDDSISIDEKVELLAEMDNQFERIEVLMGYIKGSWTRGV